MQEPIFPSTGERVVPLSEFKDPNVTVVVSKHSRRFRSEGCNRVLFGFMLALCAAILLASFPSRRSPVKQPVELKAASYEILPASLIEVDPFLEYTIKIPPGEWVDTRITIRRNQEISIYYADGSGYEPWAIKTDAGDETKCPDRCLIASNRWSDGHQAPISSNHLLGKLNQDTLKMAVYRENSKPITVNVIVRNREIQ